MSSSRRRSCVAFAAGLAAAVACAEATSTAAPTQRIGTLQLEREPRTASPGSVLNSAVRRSLPPDAATVLTAPAVIDAPDTVRAGEPFRVNITTIGENGCWRANGHELQVAGNRADVVPWDAHSGADACAEVLAYLAHALEVTFPEPGTGAIRVTGARRRQHGDTRIDRLTAEQTVVVR